MNLKVISGIIFAVLGVVGMVAVTLASSPAVSTTAYVLGIIGFMTLTGYGASKALDAKWNVD